MSDAPDDCLACMEADVEVARLTAERDALAQRVEALNKRIDALQKAKPAFLTDYQRMWDLVRHQRAALMDAELITREEFALLVAAESEHTKAAGSPSPRRLESYDEIRYALTTAQQDAARLREALVKVRAHTSYTTPTIELLAGLLASIERIADAAITAPRRP